MIDNLEIIKIKVKELEKETANKDNRIVKKLQEINECFLQNYMLQIDDLKIYPVEIESYYYSNFFKDEIVHQYHLQRDKEHLGKIYFHRYKNSNKINFCRGGFDICLSQNNFSNNKEGYCLSLLIRSAYINKELICGINKLLMKVLNIKSRKNISKQIINEYEKLENAYKDKNTYGSYGFINSFKCNEYNDKNNDNDETDCEDKYPQKPSDCKLSSSELLNNNDVCCYRKTYTGYCEKHSKSEIDSIVNRLDTYTTFICISSNEFLKVSLLSLILFLFL